MFDMIGAVWVRLGLLRDCWGEWGLEGKMGRYQHTLQFEIFITLTIAHNVKDKTNYVKSLVTTHNTAILEKVREIPIRIFHI